MLKKLIIVYNPRSSHHKDIEREVLAPVRKLQGWLVGKYEIAKASVDENAQNLAKILHDGDLVIVAGGDGTSAVAVNGVMLSEKDVTMGVIGYGNFNDMARMLKTKRPVEYGDEYVGGVSEIINKFEAGKVTELKPLDVKVNGKHWRYAPCYFTVGLFAESTKVFNEEKVREKLKTGKKSLGFSVWQLIKWYFRHHKDEFLTSGELRRVEGEGVTQEQEDRAEEVKEEKEEKEEEEVGEDRGSEVDIVREKIEKKEALRLRRERAMESAKERVQTGWTEFCRFCKEIWQKVKAKAVEFHGRSKAEASDLKVRAEVKVAETRQKRQEKREREIAERPEIIIDTELTRSEQKVSDKKKEKEEKDGDQED